MRQADESTRMTEKKPYHRRYNSRIRAYDFTANNTITIQLYDSPGGSADLGEYIPPHRWGWFPFLALQHVGVLLHPGRQLHQGDR